MYIYTCTCIDVHIVLQVGLGDFVSVCPENESEAVYIAQIISLWEDKESVSYRKQFHARWFSRSSDTVLGEVGCTAWLIPYKESLMMMPIYG